MASKITTRILDENQYESWNDLVSGSPQGSIYSRPEYLDIICSTAGGRFRIFGCFKGDEIVGGVGVYENNSRFGQIVTNRLLLYYNGIVLCPMNSSYPSQRTSKEIEILAALESRLSGMGYASIILHNRSTLRDLRPFVAAGWQVTPGYTYVMSLSDTDEMWSRIEQNQRRLIRRCESNGVSTDVDGDFDSFYALHEDTHLRKGAPLYLPKEFFRSYYERLNSLGWCRLYNARLSDGKPVATQLVLACSHPVTHTVCAAADSAHLRTGTTPFLRIRVCEDLAKAGYVANDLTDAALNPVTRFKSQLGGDLKMTLLLSSRPRLAYRLGSTLERHYYSGREICGKAVRTMLKRQKNDG
jgi:hypothetical protein